MKPGAVKQILVGFAVRAFVAAAISLFVWWLLTTPFKSVPLPGAVVIATVRVLNFPVALAGELLYPIRGFDLVFENGSSWCDFCPPGQMLWMQLRLAIPVYIVLFYVPALTRGIARRNPRFLMRGLIGLLIYSTFALTFPRLSSGLDPRGNLRFAAAGFVILTVAAAFAWSHLSSRLKLAGVLGVMFVGAYALGFTPTLIAATVDEAVAQYTSRLALLFIGVGGTLSLVWATEKLLDSLRGLRREPATSH